MTTTITLPTKPRARFLECLDRGGIYVEYGAGGSTIAAARCPGISHVITVDTSAEWLRRVAAEIEEDFRKKWSPIHLDVGEVGEWGWPRGRSHIAEWRTYATAPWKRAASLRLDPDLVLIDGRFRVASLCASLLLGRPGTVILFDDYASRPEYHRVETFAAPVTLHGRMAEFAVPERPAAAIMLEMIDSLLDPA